MRFQSILAVVSLLAIGSQAWALPKTILEGENGIIVEDDGSTKIDGETGITLNSQGQTTNVGGSSGITIDNSASRASNATAAKAPAKQPKAAGNSTASNGLAALLGAAQGSSKKNSTSAASSTGNSNSTAKVSPPGVSSNSQLASIFGALEGARKVKRAFWS